MSSTACDRGVAQYRDGGAPSETVASPPSAAPKPTQPTRADRKKFNKGETPFYIDGKLVAMVRYGELPPSFEPTIVDRRGEFTLCNVARFMEAHGVDIAKVKALHLEGSGRVAAMTGDELRVHEDDLHFAFSKHRGTFGKPLMDWPKRKVHATTRIDKMAAMQVFVDKPAPTWDQQARAFLWADGSEVEGRPYVGKREIIKGARLYVDGKLVTLIDDVEELPEELWRVGGGKGSGKTTEVVSEDEAAAELPVSETLKGGGGGGKKVILSKYLAHHGVDVAKIKTIEIIGEDRVLGRYDQALWLKVADTLRFGAPRRRAKRIRVEVDEPATDFPGPVNAQAIAVYIDVKPRDREIAQPRRRPRRK